MLYRSDLLNTIHFWENHKDSYLMTSFMKLDGSMTPVFRTRTLYTRNSIQRGCSEKATWWKWIIIVKVYLQWTKICLQWNSNVYFARKQASFLHWGISKNGKKVSTWLTCGKNKADRENSDEVGSSGIAATLLDDRQTYYSTFKLSLNLISMWIISKGSPTVGKFCF